jgi:hypothetical protein
MIQKHGGQNKCQKRKEGIRKKKDWNISEKTLNRNNYNCDDKNWREKNWSIMENTWNSV